MEANKKLTRDDILSIHSSLAQQTNDYFKQGNTSKIAEKIFGKFYQELNYMTPSITEYLELAQIKIRIIVLARILNEKSDFDFVERYVSTLNNSTLQKILNHKLCGLNTYLSHHQSPLAKFYFGIDCNNLDFTKINNIDRDKKIQLLKVISQIILHPLIENNIDHACELYQVVHDSKSYPDIVEIMNDEDLQKLLMHNIEKLKTFSDQNQKAKFYFGNNYKKISNVENLDRSKKILLLNILTEILYVNNEI